MIEVKKKNSQEFVVTVSEKDKRTEHAVTVDDEYYKNLTQGAITKEELIKRSFGFLLEREPKESILSKFNLRIIKNYFPEFEGEMSSNLKR
ncbi:MAG: hypothetical protein AMJ89_04820 [candidate division Zixibacteria bacterium SM23_73]|nr:MAG: hypothetical protein AMJ89_04820 [candidate division Zixibacteria bacterium SM23_73]